LFEKLALPARESRLYDREKHEERNEWVFFVCLFVCLFVFCFLVLVLVGFGLSGWLFVCCCWCCCFFLVVVLVCDSAQRLGCVS
jgi:hypothetical protein